MPIFQGYWAAYAAKNGTKIKEQNNLGLKVLLVKQIWDKKKVTAEILLSLI